MWKGAWVVFQGVLKVGIDRPCNILAPWHSSGMTVSVIEPARAIEGTVQRFNIQRNTCGTGAHLRPNLSRFKAQVQGEGTLLRKWSLGL